MEEFLVMCRRYYEGYGMFDWKLSVALAFVCQTFRGKPECEEQLCRMGR